MGSVIFSKVSETNPDVLETMVFLVTAFNTKTVSDTATFALIRRSENELVKLSRFSISVTVDLEV